ncbi:MAG: transglutaminase domain-containing protein, partial [Lachnospiraceae bacterium]|nr:transglutaminase domain-containing protein [Lachnospiraceae bacterium]
MINKIKRKANKYISIILITSMIISALSGCGSRKGNVNNDIIATETDAYIERSYTPSVISNDLISDMEESNTQIEQNSAYELGLLADMTSAIEEEDYTTAALIITDLSDTLISDEDVFTALDESDEKAMEEVSAELSDEAAELLKARREQYITDIADYKEGQNGIIADIKDAIDNEDNESVLKKLNELEIIIAPSTDEIYGEKNNTYNIDNAFPVSYDSSLQGDMDLLSNSGAMELSDEIKEIAKELGTPLEVYNYVKNTVDFSNYYGLRKGATATFDSGIGNDVDQATLLIAMLRYLGYPAGYKTGIIKLDEEAALNLTGASDLTTAANILSSMGEKTTLVSISGKPSYITKEHTWVLAYVPYTDYRGAGAATGDSIWIDFDTSIKTYQDAESLYEIFEKNYPDLNTPEQYTGDELVLALDEGIEEYYTNAEAYFQDIIDNDKEAVISSKNRCIEQIHEMYLPLSLQYDVLSEGEIYDTEEDMCDSISLTIGDGETLKLKSYELYSKRLTIEYEGATDEDREIIDAYGGVFLTPAYAAYVSPVIKLDGVEISRGEETTLGSKQKLYIEVRSGATSESTENNLTAGSMYSIITDLQTITLHEALSLKDDLAEVNDRIGDRWDTMYAGLDIDDETDDYIYDETEEEKWSYA